MMSKRVITVEVVVAILSGLALVLLGDALTLSWLSGPALP